MSAYIISILRMVAAALPPLAALALPTLAGNAEARSEIVGAALLNRTPCARGRESAGARGRRRERRGRRRAGG